MTLDPRPVRMLTSRELAHLIGSQLGYQLGYLQGQRYPNLLTASEIERPARAALCYVSQHVDALPGVNKESLLQLITTDPVAGMIASPILAMLTDLGLIDMASIGEVATALTWWLEGAALADLVLKTAGMFDKPPPATTLQ